MSKRSLLVIVVAVVLIAGIVMAIPPSRNYLRGRLANERFYQGVPSSAWIQDLADSDVEKRSRAAQALGEIDVFSVKKKDEPEYRNVVTALLNGLGDDNGRVRKNVATSILLIPKDTVDASYAATVPSITKAMKDSDVTVRRVATQLPGLIGANAKSAVPELTAALKDEDDLVRENAARSLGEIGPDAKSAVAPLLERLQKDEERDVREHAAKALGRIGPQAIGEQISPVVQGLIVALKDEARDVRENAARSLGQLGPDAKVAIPALKSTLKDQDAEVRAKAEEALRILDH